jgi:hypothetical protein
MFVTGVNCAHTMPFGQSNAPVHIAVTEQGEMRIDAFCGKGVSQHVVKAVVSHFVGFPP